MDFDGSLNFGKNELVTWKTLENLVVQEYNILHGVVTTMVTRHMVVTSDMAYWHMACHSDMTWIFNYLWEVVRYDIMNLRWKIVNRQKWIGCTRNCPNLFVQVY